MYIYVLGCCVTLGRTYIYVLACFVTQGRTYIYVLGSGGVRTKTAMHYFDEFPTWRNFVVMRAVYRVSLIIVCTTFAGLFSATILDLKSSGIVK